MGQIKINVTEEDILNGKIGQANNCAIALAIQRELDRRDRENITVSTATILVDGKKYTLPKKGQQFVHKFDHDKKSAKPFSFMLREAKQPQNVYQSSYMVMPSMAFSSTYTSVNEFGTIHF